MVEKQAVDLDDREAVANLIRSGQAGAERVIQEIIRTHVPRIRRYVQRKCGWPDEAIVQDAITKLWRALGQYDPERGSVEIFVFEVARSVVRDHHRRSARQPEHAAGGTAELDERRQSQGHRRNGRALGSRVETGDADSNDVERSLAEPTEPMKQARAFFEALPPQQRAAVDAYRPGSDWAADYADAMLSKQHGVPRERVVALHPVARRLMAARVRRNLHEAFRKFREIQKASSRHIASAEGMQTDRS
jgi:RNA polymerase sigma factor (sigma-70 family)